MSDQRDMDERVRRMLDQWRSAPYPDYGEGDDAESEDLSPRTIRAPRGRLIRRTLPSNEHVQVILPNMNNAIFPSNEDDDEDYHPGLSFATRSTFRTRHYIRRVRPPRRSVLSSADLSVNPYSSDEDDHHPTPNSHPYFARLTEARIQRDRDNASPPVYNDDDRYYPDPYYTDNPTWDPTLTPADRAARLAAIDAGRRSHTFYTFTPRLEPEGPSALRRRSRNLWAPAVARARGPMPEPTARHDPPQFSAVQTPGRHFPTNMPAPPRVSPPHPDDHHEARPSVYRISDRGPAMTTTGREAAVHFIMQQMRVPVYWDRMYPYEPSDHGLAHNLADLPPPSYPDNNTDPRGGRIPIGPREVAEILNLLSQNVRVGANGTSVVIEFTRESLLRFYEMVGARGWENLCEWLGEEPALDVSGCSIRLELDRLADIEE